MGEVDGRDRPDGGFQLTATPDREPLTEHEARRIGRAANRLPYLRSLRKDAERQIGALYVGSGYSSRSVTLSSYDLVAALSVIIERDELLLASFNVTVERT